MHGLTAGVRPGQVGSPGGGSSSSSSGQEDDSDGFGEDPPDGEGDWREEQLESEAHEIDEITTPTSVADSPASGSPEKSGGDEEGREEEEEPEHHGASSEELEVGVGDVAVNRAGGDEVFYNEETGLLWIWHRARRRRFVRPDAEGCLFPAEYFAPVRWTRCENADETNPLELVEIEDLWEVAGNCEGPFEWWTGWSVFLVQGYDRPRGFPWDLGNGGENEDQRDSGNGGPDDDEQDGTADRESGGDQSDDQVDAEGSSPEGQTESGPVEEGEEQERSGEEKAGEESRRCGGSRWVSFEGEKIDKLVELAAFEYIKVVDEINDQEAETWRKVCGAGDRLLRSAGSVEQAAKALWIAREHLGRNNLQGVDDPCLDGLLHPDHLAYLREIREQGMPARYEGERQRLRTQPHPRARENMGQVFRQLMKDVAKHRVLVVRSDHEGLRHTASSPFEAVPKMLPNRTISTEVRLVHDQRMINSGTSKDLHPPALQPLHVQIIRRILFWKSMFPKIPIVLAKKDVAGAFRLLWVDPADVELFAGDVPWQPEAMGAGEDGRRPDDPEGLTLLFLVSSFGFSGSPGEWTVWGRGTEELHRGFRPKMSRRDGAIGFDGKILVDDMVLVEPCVGLRPWVSSEVYEWAVRQLLGKNAINAAKDAEEGVFAFSQTVWGINIKTVSEKMSLPEARVLKGAYLLAEPQFNFGEKKVTLKEMQRFRGIATGWAVVVKGLKNELKAADRFLGGSEGGAQASPSKCMTPEDEEQAWEDLWLLFEDCRWLCSRSETWAEKFGGDIREALNPMERLALPGDQYRAAVFVSSDATPTTLGSIDWTHGLVCRQEIEELKPWIKQVLVEEEIYEEGPLAIHLGEMLSFVAFACAVGERWKGKVVLYGGDNKTVYHWVTSRRSGIRAGRLLIRVLNLVEMRYRCLIIGGWWRTYHNEDADAITRLSAAEVEQKIQERGWSRVDLRQAVRQALEDTERFGPCFLSWNEEEDRYEQMKLRELRRFRALQRQPQDLQRLKILEWTGKPRRVKDFEYFNVEEGNKQGIVVAATVGPDPRGKLVRRFWDYLIAEEFDVAVLEGPRDVAWEIGEHMAEENGFKTAKVEFLTSELGETLVRRRRALFISRNSASPQQIEEWMLKEVTPPSLWTVLEKADPESWQEYERWETAYGKGNHQMLPVVGGHVWMHGDEERRMAYKLNGPCRWPLTKEAGGVEELYVVDRAAPAGMVRRLKAEEVWRAQGRTRQEWKALVDLCGEEEALRQGCLGTGRKTALSLLGAAAELFLVGENDQKAGMCFDIEDGKSLGSLLVWLRRWRRGDYGRAAADRKAGGSEKRQVWLWGEGLWLDALIYDGEDEEETKAGGRRKSTKAAQLEGQKVVELRPGLVGDLNIQDQVEEWLDEHMTGDKAESTQKAYNAAWQR